MKKMCEFKGKIDAFRHAEDIPKRIRCPKCKRRMKPCVIDVDWYEHIVMVPRHKIKGWYKK